MQHRIHSTFDTHSALCMDHYKCHSGSFKSFTVITPAAIARVAVHPTPVYVWMNADVAWCDALLVAGLLQAPCPLSVSMRSPSRNLYHTGLWRPDLPEATIMAKLEKKGFRVPKVQRKQGRPKKEKHAGGRPAKRPRVDADQVDH